jgi:hypothetical protein
MSGKLGGVEGSYILYTSQGTRTRCNLKGKNTMFHQQPLCVQKLEFFQSSFLLQMLLLLRRLFERLGTCITVIMGQYLMLQHRLWLLT